MQQTTTLDKITYAFLIVIYLVGLYLDQTDRIYFDTQYAQEDGFVENISALGLLFVTLVLWIRLIKLWSSKSITWKMNFSWKTMLKKKQIYTTLLLVKPRLIN